MITVWYQELRTTAKALKWLEAGDRALLSFRKMAASGRAAF